MNAKIVILIAALACQASANVRRLSISPISFNLGGSAEGRPAGGPFGSLIGGFTSQLQTAGQGFNQGLAGLAELASQLPQSGLGLGQQVIQAGSQVPLSALEYGQQAMLLGNRVPQAALEYGQQAMLLGSKVPQAVIGLGQDFAAQVQNGAQQFADGISSAVGKGLSTGRDIAQKVVGNIEGGAALAAKYFNDVANAAQVAITNAIAQGRDVAGAIFNRLKEQAEEFQNQGYSEVAGIFQNVISQGASGLTSANIQAMMTQLSNIAPNSEAAQDAIMNLAALASGMDSSIAPQMQQALGNFIQSLQNVAPQADQFLEQLHDAGSSIHIAAQQAAANAQIYVEHLAANAQVAAEQAVAAAEVAAQQAVAAAQVAAEKAVAAAQVATEQAVAAAQQAGAVAQQAAAATKPALALAQQLTHEAQVQIPAQMKPLIATSPVSAQTLVAQPPTVQVIQPAIVEA